MFNSLGQRKMRKIACLYFVSRSHHLVASLGLTKCQNQKFTAKTYLQYKRKQNGFCLLKGQENHSQNIYKKFNLMENLQKSCFQYEKEQGNSNKSEIFILCFKT